MVATPLMTQIAPSTIELSSTLASLVLTSLLVLLYWRQSNIQDKQREIMEMQAEVQKLNLRSFVEISDVRPAMAPSDTLKFSVENKGKSNITNLHGWLHLEDSSAEVDSFLSKIEEETGVNLSLTPIAVEKANSDWPKADEIYSVVIEPGETVELQCKLMLHDEEGYAVSLSEIIEDATNLKELDFFAIHLSLLYDDATGMTQSKRVFGMSSFGPPDCGTFKDCFESMSHGVVLKDEQALNEYNEYKEQS